MTMTDSTETISTVERFQRSIDLAAARQREEAEQAERERQETEGRLLLTIDQMDLPVDKLLKILAFVDDGCEVVNDQTLVAEVQSLQQQVVQLSTERDDLRQQNAELGGDHTIAFTSAEEKSRGLFILDKFTNGDGMLQDNQTVTNRLNVRQRQPRRQQQGPSGPPTQPAQTTQPHLGPGQQNGDDDTSSTDQTGSRKGKVKETVKNVAKSTGSWMAGK